jgi:tyrosinase
MREISSGLDRRTFLASLGATTALTAIPATPGQAAAKYTRYNATSAEGKRMLASYAKGIRAMLEMPAKHPHNWFRNAFVHFMDCPHGNWWFYVWHRGYVGLFEQTIRKLSNDPAFTMPFWDWSELPRIPDEMFDGVLTPTDQAYKPYTSDIATFTNFIQPALKEYWNALSEEQRAQQEQRGVTSFEELWDGVTGGSDPANGAFAVTARARYLTRERPELDKGTTFDASRQVVLGGLAPTFFYASDAPAKYLQALSFNSVRTGSHVTQPGGTTWFSVLEGMPHNNVHNDIGGVGPWDPGPYGYMTNFLSSVDPVFFLHHANIDRLWDVWTRKQKEQKLSYRPNDKDAPAFMNERFRFFVNSGGQYLTDAKAGDFFDTEVFGYDYAPGTGDELISGPAVAMAAAPVERMATEAAVRGNIATLTLPTVTPQTQLVAAVTLQLPAESGRSFDVLVNAPPGVTQADPGSPFFAGRIAFFGPIQHIHDGGATFLVPLTHPQPGGGVRALAALPGAGGEVNITVVPSQGHPAPVVKAVSVQSF